jgi:hypothetical protein
MRKDDATLSGRKLLDKKVMEAQAIIEGCMTACDKGNDQTKSGELIASARVSLRKMAKDIRTTTDRE